MNEKNKKKRGVLGIKEERVLLMKAQEAFRKAENSEKVPRDLLKAAQTLVYRGKNLVKYLAYGYSFFSDSTQEEKVSAGIEVFPKAIMKFDFKFKGRFVTYLGHWVKQHFQSLSKKNSIISRSSSNDQKGSQRSVIFYDAAIDDNISRETYTLVDTLYDHDDLKSEISSLRQKDIFNRINHLLTKIENPDDILLIRLSYNIPPVTLLDIYGLANEEEKKKMEKKIKSLYKKFSIDFLKSIIFKEDDSLMKKIPIIKKYNSIFSLNKKWKFPELSSYFNEKESYLRRERKRILNYLNEKSKEEGEDLNTLI